MAAILVLADGPKSMASVLKMVYQNPNLKSIGGTVLKILRPDGSQVRWPTNGRTN